MKKLTIVLASLMLASVGFADDAMHKEESSAGKNMMGEHVEKAEVKDKGHGHDVHAKTKKTTKKDGTVETKTKSEETH